MRHCYEHFVCVTPNSGWLFVLLACYYTSIVFRAVLVVAPWSKGYFQIIKSDNRDVINHVISRLAAHIHALPRPQSKSKDHDFAKNEWLGKTGGILWVEKQGPPMFFFFVLFFAPFVLQIVGFRKVTHGFVNQFIIWRHCYPLLDLAVENHSDVKSDLLIVISLLLVGPFWIGTTCSCILM